MSDDQRPGALKPPQGGWPTRPIGDADDREQIATWLLPNADNREHSIVIRDRSDAAQHVYKVAWELLRDLQSSAKSPTLVNVRERLEEIQRRAKELDRLTAPLTGPDGLMRAIAMECGLFVRSHDPNGPEYRLANEHEVLASPLRLLAETARQYRAELSNPSLPRRGKQCLHDRLFGDPRRRFGWSCTLLLRECRGGEEAPVPSSAAVLELMNRIWAYAVGDDAPVDFLKHEAEAGARMVREGKRPVTEGHRMRGLIRPKKSN